MDAEENSLPNTINLQTFPAKLWSLVNSPTNKSTCWDSRGELIVIDEQLFQSQILSPGTNIFRTTKFSSFIRQLNLYGFRKVEPPVYQEAMKDFGFYHYFFNPNFKRNHPELLANLTRLTVDNKAKLLAGLEVNRRHPSRYQHLGMNDDSRNTVLKMKGPSPLQPTRSQSTHPYDYMESQKLNCHCGTPVRPPDPVFPSAFTPVRQSQIPVSLSHQSSGEASISNTMQVQQGLHRNRGNPHILWFTPWNAQRQSPYCPTVYHCCHPNLVRPDVTGLQTQSYYQEFHPMEDQEVKESNINLDLVFQNADEMMLIPPRVRVVGVEIPKEPVAVSEPAGAHQIGGNSEGEHPQ